LAITQVRDPVALHRVHVLADTALGGRRAVTVAKVTRSKTTSSMLPALARKSIQVLLLRLAGVVWSEVLLVTCKWSLSKKAQWMPSVERDQMIEVCWPTCRDGPRSSSSRRVGVMHWSFT